MSNRFIVGAAGRYRVRAQYEIKAWEIIAFWMAWSNVQYSLFKHSMSYENVQIWPIFIDLFNVKLKCNVQAESAVVCRGFFACGCCIFWLLESHSFHCAVQLPANSSRFFAEIDPSLCECAHGCPGLMYGVYKHLCLPVVAVNDVVFEST